MNVSRTRVSHRGSVIRATQLWRTSAFAAVCASALSGCGGGGEDKAQTTSVTPKSPTSSASPAPTTPSPAAAKPAATPQVEAKKAAETASAPAGMGTFAGRVLIEGAPPVLKPLVSQGQAGVRDAEVCATHEIPDESLVVGEGNGVANVFVYLGSAPKSAVSPPPSQSIDFDQKGCRYVPHAAVFRTKQLMLVKSDDAVQHNVHTSPARNAPFNQLIKPNNREGLELRYEQSEREPLEVKCDIHPWMRAYQLPLDHQFGVVTDAAGHFEIKDLPAGKHEFRIWHERGKFLERKYEVEVKPGETTTVEIKVPAEKFAMAQGT